MTDVAVPTVGHITPWTWREAITPSSRASRRRWTLAYALLLCFGGLYYSASWPDGGGAAGLGLVALGIVFGMLRRGTRRLTSIEHPDLDERDMLARDRAFRLAYPLLLVVLFAVPLVLVLALPDGMRTVQQANLEGHVEAWYLQSEALIGLSLWVALWAIFLPTGVLAWLEPDALEGDPDRPELGLTEITRDALLAAALVGGLVIGLLQDNVIVPLVPLVGVLMLLGAAARRAARQRLLQPPVRAATFWRLVAFVVTLAVIFGGAYLLNSP